MKLDANECQFQPWVLYPQIYHSSRLSVEHRLKTELQDLLTDLTRLFRANETRITADQVLECLKHFLAMESSALDRLVFLLYRNKVRDPVDQFLSHIATLILA